MILEVALGIVLGFIILKNLEEILTWLVSIIKLFLYIVLPIIVVCSVLFWTYENKPQWFMFLMIIPMFIAYSILHYYGSIIFKKVSNVIDPYGPKIKKLFTKA